jgi:conjugal transfer pilus assembly protein TraB
MNLKSKWDELPARTKHITIIGGAVALVVVAAMVFGDNSSSTPFSSSEPEDKNVSVFNTNSARETGIDGLASQVRQMQNTNEALIQRLDRISEENEGLKEAVKNATEAEALGKALADIRGEVGMIKQENENLQTLVEEYRTKPNSGSGNQFQDAPEDFQQDEEAGEYGIWEPDGTAGSTEPDNEYVVSTNPMKDFEESVPPAISTSEDGFDGGSGESSSSTQPRMITSVTASAPEQDESESDDSDEGSMIPAGSIVSGVLLTGMDAPTGSGARQDPFPATIRINKEAILPNRFRADIRECFMAIFPQNAPIFAQKQLVVFEKMVESSKLG